MGHQWNPKQYEKFKVERQQPFFDLLQLLHPIKHPRILDIGCGNGSLTQYVHNHLQASYTLGIDQSKEMLEKARLLQTDTLQFEKQDARSFKSEEPFSLIISNAALQWIPDHPQLLKVLTQLLAPEGQLAIQMSANQDYPTHTIAEELAKEPPFREALQEAPPPSQILSMESYAHLLNQLGFESQAIRLQLYPHFLESTASVVEWVMGSLLTYYKSYLGEELYALFLKEYRDRLIARLGWSEPFFFPMKRLFIWGQLPAL